MWIGTRIFTGLSAMKQFFLTLFAVYAFAPVSIAFAYGVPTHRDLSVAAVDVSVLQTDPTVLSNLGLKSLDALDQTFPNSIGQEHIIRELIQDGAEFED